MNAVLFVCSGNTCRSPMAAALAGRHLPGVSASSAGISAVSGLGASWQAAAVMEEMGLSLAGHRSQPLTREAVAGADVVLAMEEWHRRQVAKRFPDAASRVFTLRGYTGPGGDVADPFGGDLDDYRRCARELDDLVRALVGRISS